MTDDRAKGLERLKTGLDRTRGGESTVLLIRGGIGVGKSWLIDRLLDDVDDDVCVLRGIGHPAEIELPFAGLHQLLTPLLHRLPELPEQQATAVAAALALRNGNARDRLAVSAGVLGLVTLEAETRPVLILVDDLHWIDISTRQAITFVARRLDADAVMIALAGRTDEGSAALEIGFERLDLGPLSETDGRALLRERHPDLSPDVAARVIEEAAGLPLALVQIPSDLTVDQRTGRTPLPVPLPPGTALDEFYAARLHELGDDGRRALALASLDELTLEQLADALTGLGLSLSDLAPAEAAGLIRVADTGCAFAHPTVRSAAQRASTFTELREAHAAILSSLAPRSARAAWHLDALTTGPDERVADALDLAANDAWGRSAYEEAGRAWRASADRTPDAATAQTRRAQAVGAYLRCGSQAALAVVLGRLIDDSASIEEGAQWQSLLLITGLYSDSEPPQREHIEAMAAALLPQAPDAAARLLTNYALILMLEGETRQASAIVDGLRAMLPGHDFALGEALVHDDIDLLAGRPGAGVLLNSDWDEHLTDAELCDPSVPVSPTVVHIAWVGNVERARRIIDRQYLALQAGGGISLMELCLAQRAVILQLAGNWSEAHAAFTSAADLSLASDFAAPLPHIRLRHAYLLAARGDEALARGIVANVLALPASQRIIHRHLAACVLGLLELTIGNHANAVEYLVEAGRLERRMGTREPAFYSRVGDLFEVLWRLKREGEALAELDDFEEQARAVGRTSAIAIATRCRGMVAKPDQIDELFSEALALHEQAANPFEIARTELAWGQRLRRERRKSDARAPLHRALDSFESLGAAPWAATALAELAACGERRAPDAGGTTSNLTPRELEVAIAVAAGASNAETAARLVVSRRTVEYHLASVFRKLGVRSRAELAELLAA